MKRFSYAILATALSVSASAFQPVSAKPRIEQNQLLNVAKSIKSSRESRLKLPFRDKNADALNAMMYKSGIKKAPAVDLEFSDLDNFITLDGPDGLLWYATCEYDFTEIKHDYYVERILNAFKYTIYNSAFEKVGELKDKIEYKDDETGAALYELCPVVSQKFFNYDNNYEVLFTLGVHTEGNVNRYYSIAYSLNGEKDADGNDVPLTTIDGLLVNSVNAAQDSWSENIFMTFSIEESDESKLDSENYLDYLETYKMVLTTYKKASYNGGPQVVAEKKIRYMDLPGDQQNTPALITYAEGGKAYFVYSQYEKSFFVDPVGEDESVTEDNNLFVDIYSMGSYGNEMTLEKHIAIPTEQIVGEDKLLWTYYGVGNLGYSNDIIKEGDDFKLVVAKQKCLITSDDSTTDSYYIYDSEGKQIKTLVEDIDGFVGLSDITGYEHQYMFITLSNMGYLLSFIDVPSGDVVAMLSSVVDGYGLTANVDRVPAGLGYKYAFKVANPVNENGDEIEQVVWIDTNGKILDVDKINLGDNVAMAQMYLNQSVLTPYFFNTDARREYMFLVKRYRNISDSGTDEHLVVAAANEYETLLDVTSDPVKGQLVSILPVAEKENPALILIFGEGNKYAADIYNLPFTRFAGGEGTVDNPYLIATPGDFQQISTAMSAHYRIVDDIDFSGYVLSTVKGSFTGTIDGNGKTLSNITMNNVKGMIEDLSDGSVVKNLNLYNVKINSDDLSIAGTLASSALGAKIDNVHVYALDVCASEGSEPDFGGVVGRATNGSLITNCSVNGVINLPGSKIGGIVAFTRTGSSVLASSFVGTINGGAEVGGIVGSADAPADVIADCHVDAAITALNTIGGIAGVSARANITRCYVEGSIKATGASSKWYDNGPCAGGIVGDLGPDYSKSEGSGNSDSDVEAVDPVTYCLVNLSSLEGYTPEVAPEYPTQHSTIHRIVGRSNANLEPEIIDEDADYNPIYGEPLPEESAINNNYAVADLALGHDGASADHNTVEGKSVDADDLSAEWFTNTLKLAYGTDVNAPWNEISDWDPALHHELASKMNPEEMTVMEQRTFTIDVTIVRAVPFTEEEFFDNFSYECSAEDVVEMTGNATFENGVATVEFKALKPGNATVSMFGSKCEVTVVKDPTLGIDNVTDAADDLIVAVTMTGISVRNVAVGSLVEVYNLSGMKLHATVAAGESVDIDLAPGLYIVKAGNKAVKCMVR